MLDSGVRRGTDILIARCLGADFVFVGRATLYGAVAGGDVGAERAISILADEVDRALALVGCPRAADLCGEFLLRRPAAHACLECGTLLCQGAEVPQSELEFVSRAG